MLKKGLMMWATKLLHVIVDFVDGVIVVIIFGVVVVLLIVVDDDPKVNFL